MDKETGKCRLCGLKANHENSLVVMNGEREKIYRHYSCIKKANKLAPGRSHKRLASPMRV